MEREAPLKGIFHISQKPHLTGSPVKKPSPKVPLMESFAERCTNTRALLRSSTKVPGIQGPPPPHTRFPSTGKGPPRRCPYPETFSTYLPGFPVKELPTRPPQGASSERETLHPQRQLHPSPKVPGRWAHLQVPQTGPLRKEMSVSRAFYYISYRVPSKGALPPGSLNRAPRAPVNHISKSPVKEPTPGGPNEPPWGSSSFPEPSFHNLQGPW